MPQRWATHLQHRCQLVYDAQELEFCKEKLALAKVDVSFPPAVQVVVGGRGSTLGRFECLGVQQGVVEPRIDTLSQHLPRTISEECQEHSRNDADAEVANIRFQQSPCWVSEGHLVLALDLGRPVFL